MDKPLDDPITSHMLTQNTVTIPTLTIMELFVRNLKLLSAADLNARESVTALYKAGIPIRAGQCRQQFELSVASLKLFKLSKLQFNWLKLN
jgi:hypothetical protein